MKEIIVSKPLMPVNNAVSYRSLGLPGKYGGLATTRSKTLISFKSATSVFIKILLFKTLFKRMFSKVFSNAMKLLSMKNTLSQMLLTSRYKPRTPVPQPKSIQLTNLCFPPTSLFSIISSRNHVSSLGSYTFSYITRRPQFSLTRSFSRDLLFVENHLYLIHKLSDLCLELLM